MKKKLLLMAFAISGFAVSTFAQTPAAAEIKYRRSSLHTMILEMEAFPQKETILKAFNNAPFPDKYNNHSLTDKSFDPKKYALTDAEKTIINGEESKKDMSESKEVPFEIGKYLTQNKIANQIVAKWFNRQADGSFDMNMIGERGSYNATQMEANIAKGSARGTSSLSDAGVELLGNTFVVVSKFKFVSNEVVADAVGDDPEPAPADLPPEALALNTRTQRLIGGLYCETQNNSYPAST